MADDVVTDVINLYGGIAGMAWWIACGVVLCYWTHQANKAGLPRSDWRGRAVCPSLGEFPDVPWPGGHQQHAGHTREVSDGVLLTNEKL